MLNAVWCVASWMIVEASCCQADESALRPRRADTGIEQHDPIGYRRIESEHPRPNPLPLTLGIAKKVALAGPDECHQRKFGSLQRQSPHGEIMNERAIQFLESLRPLGVAAWVSHHVMARRRQLQPAGQFTLERGTHLGK